MEGWSACMFAWMCAPPDRHAAPMGSLAQPDDGFWSLAKGGSAKGLVWSLELSVDGCFRILIYRHTPSLFFAKVVFLISLFLFILVV